MKDVIYLAVILGFFAIAAVYIRACALILGPEEPLPGDEAREGSEASAQPAPNRPVVESGANA